MKKVLAILCAFAMTVSCFSASMFAFAASNLALYQTVFVDSIHPTGGYGESPIEVVDGNVATRWQSGQDVRVSENTVYVGIAWDNEISANTFVIYWETSAAGNDKCDLYIAKSNIKESLGTFTSDRYPDETFYKDGDGIAWEKIDRSDYTYKRENATGGPKYKDTYEFSESLSFYAVKCVVTEGDNGNKDYMSCHEFEVYDFSAGTPYDVSAVNKAIAYAEKVDATVGANATAVANFNTVLANAKAAVAACNGQVVGAVDGFATQEDLDAVAGEIFNAAVNLSGTGVVAENVLEGAMMFVNPDDMQGYADGNNYFTLTDGAWENNTNCWQPKSYGTPVYLVLKTPSDMNELVIYAESDDEQYKISYTTASLSDVKSVEDMEALSWTDIDAERVYASTAGDPTEQHYAFETVEGVVAIRLECVVANLGAFAKLREVQAYNDTTFAAEVKALADAENNRAAYLTVVDRADVAGGKKVYANFTVTYNGKISVQKVAVKSAFQSVTLGANTYTAKDFAGEKVGYVTGIVLEGLTAEYDVSAVTFTIE